MSNKNAEKTIKIGLVVPVAYGVIGVSVNEGDNDVYFVTDSKTNRLERLKNNAIQVTYSSFAPFKKISTNIPFSSYSYIVSDEKKHEQPGLILRYKDLSGEHQFYLLMLTEKGELKEIFKDLDDGDIDFLAYRNTVNIKNPNPEFSYKLFVFDKELDTYVRILAFVDSNGNVTRTYKNKNGQIFYEKDSNRYKFINNEGEFSFNYYDSFGNLQLENIKEEILITGIELKDTFASGKYNIYRATVQDGSVIAYMINAETGEFVTYLDPEIDCVNIFNEFLWKFAIGENTPYIRRQER